MFVFLLILSAVWVSASLTLLVPFVLSRSLNLKQHSVLIFLSLLIGSFRLCLAIRRLKQPSYSLTASHLSCLSAIVYQAFLVLPKFRCSWAVTVYLPKYQRNYAAPTVSSSVGLVRFLFYIAITKLPLLCVSAWTQHVLTKSDGYSFHWQTLYR